MPFGLEEFDFAAVVCSGDQDVRNLSTCTVGFGDQRDGTLDQRRADALCEDVDHVTELDAPRQLARHLPDFVVQGTVLGGRQRLNGDRHRQATLPVFGKVPEEIWELVLLLVPLERHALGVVRSGENVEEEGEAEEIQENHWAELRVAQGWTKPQRLVVHVVWNAIVVLRLEAEGDGGQVLVLFVHPEAELIAFPGFKVGHVEAAIVTRNPSNTLIVGEGHLVFVTDGHGVRRCLCGVHGTGDRDRLGDDDPLADKISVDARHVERSPGSLNVFPALGLLPDHRLRVVLQDGTAFVHRVGRRGRRVEALVPGDR